jgi:hypothetical protein
LPENNPLPFSAYPLHSPHVHFPPTPTLASTSFTHSAITYDRAPIMVTENVCALPERGGRCYRPKNKQPSRHTSGYCPSGVEVVNGVGAGPSDSGALNSSEPKGSYFHPRAFEVSSPEAPYALDRPIYQFFPDPSSCAYSSSSSSSDSSITSESETDSDSSYGSLSPLSPSSIPRAVVESLSLGGAPSSTYPSDPSFIFQQQPQNGPQQTRQLAHSSISRQSYPQSQQISSHAVHYTRSPSPGLAERRPRKSAMSGDCGRKVRSGSRSNSRSPATRLAKLGGGFSDQSMVLEGCLGGF